MKKIRKKRGLLGLAQHMAAMLFMIMLAYILFHSYVSMDSMSGIQLFELSPLHSEPEFEDSLLFQNIFETSVADITRLVVIKGQLETNGAFDPKKKVDVTEYANRKGVGNGCLVTAVYELEDLIKWGKYGVEYTNRAMSMSDFVNYFGSVINPLNFALNKNGELYFKGFEFLGTESSLSISPEETISETSPEMQEEILRVEEKMQHYSEEQLEDMVFSYIMAQVSEGISLSREDDGTLTVYFSTLNGRYETVDGERQLIYCVDNWIDYMKLCANVAETVTSLEANYQQYQNCNDLYKEENTNLKYVVRVMTENGINTYTNMSAMTELQDNEITDHFSDFRRYLIYYPGDLAFMGNTGLSEEEISEYIREYEYAYPETTHIWIGVDTSYSVKGDIYSDAFVLFHKIVPYIDYILMIMMLLAVIFVGIVFYLSVTAGVIYQEETGERKLYRTGIDHIWTELIPVFGFAVIYGAYWGKEQLLLNTDTVYRNFEQQGIDFLEWYRYALFGFYGFFVSILFSIVWYSFIRRVRSRNLWKDSFLYLLLSRIGKGIHFLCTHKNIAFTILLPYNLFLLFNFAGVFGIYLFRNTFLSFICLLFVVLFDVITGMVLFRRNAEQADIVEGINRIRAGEVEYKLDANSLHGTNKEMADAVNNIGEGIRRAVKKSMKDEQLKTDLITNVSHDIKTPLTSIISYVDLLKRLKIEEEPAKSYIHILDNKSQRLKHLTDDLVEASKISSGNIVLKKEKLNLTELFNQSIGEFSEKFEDEKLQVIFSDYDKTAFIFADSRRMWRVMENLFHNVCKYAMEGTRVYIDIIKANGIIEVSMKNISKQQMNIRASELTERFIRGDSSRTTEGSGLGLYIAQSLVQVQGGTFEIQLDGDLFKVVMVFPEYTE